MYVCMYVCIYICIYIYKILNPQAGAADADGVRRRGDVRRGRADGRVDRRPRARSLALSHTLSLSHTRTLTLSGRVDRLPRARSLSLSRTHTLTHTHTLSLSHTHTH